MAAAARQAVDDAIDRIDRIDPQVRAVLHRLDESAQRRADELDSNGAGLPLAGDAVAVKDNICTIDGPTTCGSRILEGFQSPYDAHVIERLHAAGAIPIAKTNLDEFAMGSSTENSAFFQTRNPWNTQCVPGGSSGGSVVAVACRMVPYALGSDTGGSIRQPASFCGVTGLKPTYGRVSRYGLVAFASSLDQIGPIAVDAAGVARVLKAIAGHDPRDTTSVDEPVPDYVVALHDSFSEVRIGMAQEYFGEGLHPEVRAAVAKAIDVYRGLGAKVETIPLPHTKYTIACYYLICTAEASSNLARFDGVRYGRRAAEFADYIDMYAATRAEGFGPEVRRRIMLGTFALSSGYYDAYYLKALKVRTLIRQDFLTAFEKCDVIVSPTTPTPAFRLGEKTASPLEMYLGDIYTVAANLAGLPAISFPCGFSEAGLPIGLQLMAPPFAERRLLQLAHAYQQATDFHTRKPPICAE